MMIDYTCDKCGKRISELDYDPDFPFCYDCMASDLVDEYVGDSCYDD